jgi:hypothetical protein
MGPWLAKLNGYKHGWEDKVTSNICTLVKGTTEYYAWHWGYLQGQVDLMDAKASEETVGDPPVNKARWEIITACLYHARKQHQVFNPSESWEIYCQGNGFGTCTPEQLKEINGGWDWSHVRDSDSVGVDRMYSKLKEILQRRTPAKG